MIEYGVLDMAPRLRCRWVYDEHYQTVGSVGLETPEETAAAEQYELERLRSGEWVVLGCIVETQCETCDEWHERDALWGIVIEPSDLELRRFAIHSMELGKEL